MKKCSECGVNDIEDKYIFCIDCAKKEKEKREKEQTESFKGIPHLIEAINEVNKSIGALNNNVYALRVIEEHNLSKENKALIWDKKKANKKGDFKIK